MVQVTCLIWGFVICASGYNQDTPLDYEEMESDEGGTFDIDDRIRDIIGSRGAYTLDDSSLSDPSTSEFSPVNEMEIATESSIKLEIKDDNIVAKTLAESSSGIGDETATEFKLLSKVEVKEEVEDNPNHSFNNLVLKTLAERFMNTGTAFVLSKSLNCPEDKVSSALSELKDDKLVCANGSAWQVVNDGFTHLKKLGVILPDRNIKPTVRRGDQNIYHTAKNGAGRGVPLNPLELLGTETRFGIQGIGRGAQLARIIADVKDVTNPSVRRNETSLLNMTAESVIGQRNVASDFGTSQQYVTNQESRAKPQSLTNQEQLVRQQSLSSHFHQCDIAMPDLHKRGIVSSGIHKQLNLPLQIRERSVASSQTLKQQLLQNQGLLIQRKLPLTPMDLINLERGGQNQTLETCGGYKNVAGLTISSRYQALPQGSTALFIQQSGASSLSLDDVTVKSQTTVSLNSIVTSNLEITTETFSGVNKNPVSALMEYAQSRASVAKIEVIRQHGPSHKPKYDRTGV